MFVKCPRCRSLVATEAGTGAPPEYCPYCDGPMAGADPAQDDASDTATAVEASAHAEAMAATDPSGTTPADEPPDLSGDPDGFGDPGDLVPASATIVPDAATAMASPLAPDLAETAETVAENPPQPTPPPAQDLDGVDADASATDPGETAGIPALSNPPAAPKRRKRAAPSFARRTANAQRRPTPPWLWAIAAGLALLAGLQILFADRAQLAADARWRPLLVSACKALHCTIPPWREPAAFAMLGRDVRQHPYMPGALRVDAAFRNNARWPQPWPELVLTLSDVDGRALGTRAFSPQEYLGDKITQKEIASGQTAAIRMDVMEPAAGVVSFTFDFR